MNVKRIIILDSSGKTIFKGSPLSLPFKKQSILDKSIELFNDPDPCIIHESYSIHQLSEAFLNVFRNHNKTELTWLFVKESVDFLDWPFDPNSTIRLEVKS